MGLFGAKTKMITADEALAGPRRHDARPRAALRQRHPLAAAVPRGLRARRVRPGLLLGRRAAVLAAPGRVHHRGRLRGRLHAEPVVRGGLLGPHRPHRGGARGVRPRRSSPTSSCSRCSGRTTTPPRGCARATTSARSTAPAIYCHGDEQRRRGGGVTRHVPGGAARRGYGDITTEILPSAGTFYYAEDYHQQYLAEEPRRLLRPRRHRAELSRRRGHRRMTESRRCSP